MKNSIPFEEFNWVGSNIKIGEEELEVVEPIERCNATKTNPQNGIRDIKDFGSSIFDKLSENFIAIIGTIIKDKPMLVCVVSRKLQEILGANEIIIPLAEIIDGGAGGKKSVSTAGGKDVSKLQEAIDKSILIIKEMIDERF